MAEVPLQVEDLSGGTRSSRVLAAIMTWTLSAFKTRGIHIDPAFKLDRSALRRVSRVVCVVPLVNASVALLELISRLILLILFLALSCAPRQRKVMVERMRETLQMHVQSVRRLSVVTEDDASVRRRKSSLPPDATVLVVGAGSVGKTALGAALHRLAKKAGRDDALVLAESHGQSLPSLDAFPELRLLIIVWEAAQGTPLPAYVANYFQQLERSSGGGASQPRRSRRGAADGGGELSPGEGRPASPTTATRGAASAPAAAVAEAPACEESLPTTSVGPTGGAAVRGREGGGASAAAGLDASEATAATGPASKPPLRVLVVCNKTDSMPCPMPQIRGLKAEQAFIAVSALRGTNLGHLWTMASPLLPTDVSCRRSEDDLRLTAPEREPRPSSSPCPR